MVFRSEQGLKNKIVGGDFRLWQRGTGGAVPGDTTQYFADGALDWCGGGDTVIAISRQTIANNGFYGAIYSHQTTISTMLNTTWAVGVTKFPCEDATLYGDEKMTFSIWAKASVAGKKMALGGYLFYGTGGAPSASVYITPKVVDLTTNWVRYSVTFTVPTLAGKTLGTDGFHTSCFVPFVCYGGGSSYTQYHGGIGLQTGVISITLAQLEFGDTATDFDRIPMDVNRARCLRLYEKSIDANSESTALINVTNQLVRVPFKVGKRLTPSVYTSSDNAIGTGSAACYNIPGVNVMTDGNISMVDYNGFSLITPYGHPTIRNRFGWLADASFYV